MTEPQRDWSQLFAGLHRMPDYDAYYVADVLDAGVSSDELWQAHRSGAIELTRVDLTDGLDQTRLERFIAPIKGARFDRVRPRLNSDKACGRSRGR